MQSLINLDDVNTKIITIRNQSVILDSDVAQLYGVETKRVNEAIKNNPDKFPEGFVFELTDLEADRSRSKFSTLNSEEILKSKISTSSWGGTRKLPKALTEQGLYMLATILKSPQATQTTLAIVSTFAKIRELSSNLAYLNSVDPEVIEPEIIESTIEKSSGLLNDLFFSELPITSAETSVEFDIGFMKGKRTVKSDVNPAVRAELDALKKRIDQMEKTRD